MFYYDDCSTRFPRGATVIILQFMHG